MKKKKVVIDVERMKYSFTGLHNYCENLYVNLLEQNQEDFEFSFFTPTSVELLSHVNRIDCSLKDKFLLTKSKDFDLWHITYQNSKYVPINNVKIVFTIHDLNFLYTDKSESKKRKLLKKVQKTIDKSAYITVISNYVLSDVKKHLNIQNKPIQVIHNGVDLKKFPNFNTPKIRPKKKFLFTLGTVLYKKNFHVLPKLIEGLDYELVIGGIHPNAEYINFLNSEIKKYHVQDRVVLTGALSEEEKYWYIKNCTAFVFPSLSEGFGIPPIEAMLMGKPVFLSTHTSLPEIGGEVAYYFESFEKAQMQKVFIDGMKDFTINNKAESTIAWAKQFNWDKASREYIEVYRKTLNVLQKTKEQHTVSKEPITALIITYNEEENIENVLKNVHFVDEIVVVDSFSTDRTLEIIAKYPRVKVLQKKFNNFSEQRNFALKQAQNDWILFIDADEYLSAELISEIKLVVNKNNKYVAFSIIRDNYIGHKLIKHSGWQNDKVYRLFNKKEAHYNQKKLVHETLLFSGKSKLLKNHLTHHTFSSYKEYKRKLKLYSELKALELYKENFVPNWYHLKIKPLYRYFYHYIIRLGFLDGKNGKLIAKINAFGIRNRYKELKKLYEKYKIDK